MTGKTFDASDYLMTGSDVREREARRIAQAEGYAIAEHDDIWESFVLDDPCETDKGTLWTAFSWIGTRTRGQFEGFVTFAGPQR